MQDLKKYFDKAGLSLTLTNEPVSRGLGRGATEIFQMTIDGGKPERFRMFIGKGTDIRVLDYSPKREQVLLYVKEPKRKFVEERWDNGKKVSVDHVTPENIRKYLMGMDERHLFISELPDRRINKIDEAVHALKPREVKDRKKRKDVKVYRQGEWFFVPATPQELIDIRLNTKFMVLNTPLPVPRGGKPHTAELLVRIGEVYFVSGRIRHEDHKTRVFGTGWFRVFRNTEKQNTITGWVD